MYVCMCVNLCVYMCMCACVRVCARVYVHACVRVLYRSGVEADEFSEVRVLLVADPALPDRAHIRTLLRDTVSTLVYCVLVSCS
jgi:hypothetical protein